MMTDEEYVEKEGCCCPECHGRNAEAIGQVEIDVDHAWLDMSCPDCEATWTERYSLVGFDPKKSTNKTQLQIETIKAANK